MKSLFKIISVICLVLLLTPLASGKYIRIRLLISEQDTSDFNKIRVDSFPLPIVPPASGVQFFRDKIMFLSLTKNERKMSSEHISFGSVEAYYASILDSVTGKHYLFSPSHPFSFPAEAVAFNRSYDTVYFTNLADNDKEKIFMAKYAMDDPGAGLRGEIISLEFCTGNYNYSHPSLSADGNIMIFASDKDGTSGGMDLFITRRTNNAWSSPENLGNIINTPGNEFFPFLDQDKNLFFSSDGLKGFGGYDIFTSKFNGKGWDKPVNLSNSINSKYDDIAFTMNSVTSKSAFFTRRSGKNEMQLFRIKSKQENNNLLSTFNGNPVPKTLTAVVTKEEKSQPAVDAPAITKPVATSEKKPEKKSTPINTGAKSTSQKTEAVKDLQPQTSDTKYAAIKPTLPVPANQKNIVIFRVQITTSEKPKKEKEIVLNNKIYSLFEYYYLGVYRYCIGEFTTLKSAAELQNICRKSSYPQAFVAAFKNDTRVLDLKSFK